MQHLLPQEAALVDALEPAPMLAQVIDWSALNSGTTNLPGLSRQAELLCDAFSILPGDITLESADPVSAIATDGADITVEHGRHLVLRVRPNASRRVLLTGHMDTVYPADHAFQGLRWLDSETLNGPGVADMKGGIAIMLAALKAFESAPCASNIGYDVLINSDEEAGSQSSTSLIERLARGKFAALTYEPSALPDGTLAGERGGSSNYSLIVTGRAAHAGRNPQDGRNALVAAAALALALKSLERHGLTINPARIDGGSVTNVVPDHAILRFNIRPRTTSDYEYFLHNISILISNIENQHEVFMRLHSGSNRPPKPLEPATERLFELVRDCGAALDQPIRWQTSGGVCDGNNIAALGVPVVDTLGARGGSIHSPEEYLIVPSLIERAALSALILHRLANGALA
jgi:glutamate carboxypeptidase